MLQTDLGRLSIGALVEMGEVYIGKSNGPRTDPWGTDRARDKG